MKFCISSNSRVLISNLTIFLKFQKKFEGCDFKYDLIFFQILSQKYENKTHWSQIWGFFCCVKFGFSFVSLALDFLHTNKVFITPTGTRQKLDNLKQKGLVSPQRITFSHINIISEYILHLHSNYEKKIVSFKLSFKGLVIPLYNSKIPFLAIFLHLNISLLR